MREGVFTRWVAVFSCVVLFGTLAVGCGGDNDEGGSSAAGAGTTTAESDAGATEDTESARPENKSTQPNGNSNQQEGAEGGSGSAPESGSTGSGEVAGSVPTQAVPDFGSEAEPSERDSAEDVLAAFLDARAAGDWEEGCAYISSDTLKVVERVLASLQRVDNPDCVSGLATLEGPIRGKAQGETLAGPVDSLRVESPRAFALYEGRSGSTYAMPMVREGVAWKVAAVAPREMPKESG